MKKSELIDRIHEITTDDGYGYSKATIEHLLNRVGDIIAEDLVAGGSTNLPSLGILRATQRKARKGHNPQTRQPIMIPAKQVAVFTPSKYLHEKMNPNRASSCGCKEG